MAALLDGDPEQALAQALAARARGITTFKFKIGRPGAFSRELAAVQGLRAELGPSARLRLDANQTLSLGRSEAVLAAAIALAISNSSRSRARRKS